jgi:uncharacterized protein YcbX
MSGERLNAAFVGFAGIYGDRVYAFRNAGAPAGFPFLTAREQKYMLLCQPRFRQTEIMSLPPNLGEAEALAPGVTTIYPPPADTAVEVATPDGDQFSIEDPMLIRRLNDGLNDRDTLSLVRSDRSLTDCRPVSIFGVWTARQLSDEVGAEVDQRRFRANIYVDFASQKGFAEDDLLGRTVKLGRKATIAILERDPRCKMITLHPETAEQNPDIMRCVSRNHAGKAGVYAAVLVEGEIHPGDEVTLVS